MGRWQTEYYDQVLGLKLKTLVCGAIARAKLERNDPHPPPQISYETFVQSLDHGDSFTTTLVDILVKELAERQKRPSSSDRHLLAERTVTSLKNLTRCRIYRQTIPAQRNFHDFYVSRSSDNTLSDWAGNPVPPDPLELEIDEEEIDPPTPPSPSDPTVFQPFAEFSGPPILRGSFAAQTADVSTDDENQHPGYQARGTPPTLPHYNLSRHSSSIRDPPIRRLVRSRTNDFNDFTTRRRALGRSSQTADQQQLDAPDRLSTTSTRRSTSSDVNVAENTAGRDRGAEIDGMLPTPSSANGNAILRRNDILRLRASEDPEYSLESALTTRSNFNLYGSRMNSAAPSSSRLTVHIPHLRRPRIRRSNQSNSALTSTDGYTHTVRIGSPPGNTHPELQSTRFSLPRSTSPLDVDYLHRLATDFTPPPFSSTDDTAASSGNNRENRERVSTINLPTPRSISPEGGSLSQ